MGGGSWTSKSWDTYKTTHIDTKATVKDIYSKAMNTDFDPATFALRESCDSVEHPNSNAVIVALDVTGSMGDVAELIARDGLKTLAEEIYSRKPIDDPQLLFMGIGDVEYDSHPVQATQFESDIRIAEQLTKLYLEQGGGGNDYESYIAAWYFAVFKTKIDCFDKRKKKGYLFTIGDEEPTPYLTKSKIKTFFGDTIQADKYTAEQLYDLASRYYNIYHIVIKETNHARRCFNDIKKGWVDLIGQKTIFLDDYTKLAEVVVSTIQFNEGESLKAIVDSWDGTTSVAVKNAIGSLEKVNASNGVVRF